MKVPPYLGPDRDAVPSLPAGAPRLAPGVDGAFGGAAARLCPELGVHELAALRVASPLCARTLEGTWRRVQGRCQLGALFETGALDTLVGREAAVQLRRQADARFGESQAAATIMQAQQQQHGRASSSRMTLGLATPKAFRPKAKALP